MSLNFSRKLFKMKSISSVIGFKRAAAVSGILLAASAATLLAVRARAAGIPAANALTYTGYLETPDGTPLTNSVQIAVGIWDAQNGGNKVCEAESKKVAPVAGRFQLALPNCQAAIAANPELWLETTVDGKSLGRTKLGAVPYAVEANHAVASDAATEGSPLAKQLAGLQGGVDALTARADAPLATSLTGIQGDGVILDKADFTWVSGVAPTKLSPGRYWVLNTSRIWAVSQGCTSSCSYAISYAVSCMRVGNKLTMSPGQVILEPALPGGSLPLSTIGAFDIAKETDAVELGFCAHRHTLGIGPDIKVGNSYTMVLPQPK